MNKDIEKVVSAFFEKFGEIPIYAWGDQTRLEDDNYGEEIADWLRTTLTQKKAEWEGEARGVEREREKLDTAIAALKEIASYEKPDSDAFEEDDDGFNEFGTDKHEAIAMAYENVIFKAEWALQTLSKQN